MPTDDYILRSDALKAILGVSIYDTIEELDGARTIAENTWADGLYDAYKIIEEEVDAADVAEVRHGRWEVGDYAEPDHHGVCVDHYPGGGLYCTECLHGWKRERVEGFEYCGAKMEEDYDGK